MAKFYADVALLLPKGSFYAEMFCINFPCVRFVHKLPCVRLVHKLPLCTFCVAK